jgi:hypothetical protein
VDDEVNSKANSSLSGESHEEATGDSDSAVAISISLILPVGLVDSCPVDDPHVDGSYADSHSSPYLEAVASRQRLIRLSDDGLNLGVVGGGVGGVAAPLVKSLAATERARITMQHAAQDTLPVHVHIAIGILLVVYRLTGMSAPKTAALHRLRMAATDVDSILNPSLILIVKLHTHWYFLRLQLQPTMRAAWTNMQANSYPAYIYFVASPSATMYQTSTHTC